MLLGSRGATNVTTNSRPSDAAVHSPGSHAQEKTNVGSIFLDEIAQASIDFTPVTCE